MPYIPPKARPDVAHAANELAHAIRRTSGSGVLNMALCTLFGELYHADPCYANIEGIVGAAHSATAEFQRRIVAGHEDDAIERNGDLQSFRRRGTP